jgi:hypothetical protein
MQDYCLAINKDVGIRFSWVGGTVYRNNVTDVGILLGANGSPQESNGDRVFSDLFCAGRWLIDVQYSQTTIISNCDVVNIQCRPTASKTLLIGNRIATLGNNFVLDGTQCSMTGNIVAGTVELNGTCLQASVTGNTIAGGILIDNGATLNNISTNSILSGNQITDNSGSLTNALWTGVSNSGNNGYGTAGQIVVSNGSGNLPSFQTIGGTATYTPVWSSNGTAPVLGNGTLTGKYSTVGNMVFVTINGVMGSTTTYGTGNYTWTLPVASASDGFLLLGSAECNAGASGAFFTGVSFNGTTTIIQAVTNAGTAIWGQTTPGVWQSGNNYRLSLAYWKN